MTEETTTPHESGSQDPDLEKLWLIFSYVPILCLIPLIQDVKNVDLQRHARQGVVLMLLEITICILLIPAVTQIILGVGLIICFLFAVIGALNAFQGRFWRIPIIGDIAEGSGFWKKYS
ncbi:hypothetical protein ACFL3X_00645 [Gemmatimonadota bacterium]